MRKGITFAGCFFVDNIKYIENYPAFQSLTHVIDVARATGGLVPNCGLTLAKLDPYLPVKVMGIIGEDEAGDYVLSQFDGLDNVDTSNIIRRGRTAATDVMTVKSTGQRTFFTDNGANKLLVPEDFDYKKLDAEIMHIGYILLLNGLDAPDKNHPTAMCRVLDAAQKAGIQTSIDVVSEEGDRFAKLVPPALKYADYCIINEHEASRTTGIKLRDESDNVLNNNLTAACNELMEMGVGRWVVIHMPEMSCAMERGGEYVQELSLKLPDGFIKSSVGAGDAFAAGILYGAYSGWSLKKSIQTAGAVAACSLSTPGATDAIKPLPELLKQMEPYIRQNK